MGDDAECEFARPGADAGRVSGAAGERHGLPEVPPGPPENPRRAVLRTSDGVAVEAVYDPYEGGGGEHRPHGGSPEGRGPGGDGPGGRRSPEGEAPGAIVLAHGFSGSAGRPAVRRAVRAFARHAAVVTFSFRGHGGSGGHSTVGDREVLDLAAAVAWARSLGHARVSTVGFSMGGSVVVRHGALHRPDRRAEQDAGPEGRVADAAHAEPEAQAAGAAQAEPEVRAASEARAGPEGRAGADSGANGSAGTDRDVTAPTDAGAGAAGHPDHSDAVVAVSAPARWYYRGTAPMRRLHWAIQRPVGRLVCRYGLRTRIHPRDWDPVPLSPVAAAPLLAPTPLLVVHGDQDPYFPVDHPRSLAAAGDPDSTELWLIEGFGHAENAAAPALLHRIGDWVGDRWSGPSAGPA